MLFRSERALKELEFIKRAIQTPPSTPSTVTISQPTAPAQTEWDEDVMIERFTPEGIDRQFMAKSGFIPSVDRWKEDS